MVGFLLGPLVGSCSAAVRLADTLGENVGVGLGALVAFQYCWH